MKRTLLVLTGIALLLVSLAIGYGVYGYFDGRNDGESLRARADALVAAQRGSAGLGPGRIEYLLTVEDPGFARHDGVDFSTDGAGMTTLTQSLGKRLGFERFRPGIHKIRLIGYAMGLEESLSKEQIVALYLDTAEMGRGPNGWMTGFYEASQAIYRRSPAQLADREFLSLVAVMIAPRRFDLRRPDAALDLRVGRIERLVRGECRPTGQRDVWLEGCAV